MKSPPPRPAPGASDRAPPSSGGAAAYLSARNRSLVKDVSKETLSSPRSAAKGMKRLSAGVPFLAPMD